MLWFGGNIADAVKLSKQRDAIFVVFIEGDNPQSAEMASTLNDDQIKQRLADEQHFLAIKLTSGSTDYVHFAQMYQFVPVPSLFFIGRSGVPLEVVCPGVQAAGLAERVDRILDEHKKSTSTPVVKPSTSSQNIKQQTTSLLQSEAKATSEATNPSVETTHISGPSEAKEVHQRPKDDDSDKSGPAAKVQKTDDYDVVCDGDVCVRVPKSNPGPSTTPAPIPQNTEENPYNAEEEIKKMERAKELIEIRRREKAEKEKELEKQKELERRATGQGVAELRRWQEEQEMKNIQEERKREKLENTLARQRILEQIAQDRAERRARELPAPAPAQPAPAAVATPGDVGTHARLQFKLPDGGSLTAQFGAEDRLGTVRDHLVENLNLNKNNFTLWTAFPRRELVEDSSTLRELALAPSAALLVVNRPGTTVPHTSASPVAIFSFISAFFSTLIFETSHKVYTWLRERLFPTPPPPTAAPQGEGGEGRPREGLRRRGNVHRLAGDADDDNNTWNGNSTQQM